MTPSWYDVLGVAPDASTDEIRRVWRTSVDGLDPTDRLFRQRNRAAEVLLDPGRRSAHDADLAADAEDEADDASPADRSPVVEVPAKAAVARSTKSTSSTASTASDETTVVRPTGGGLKLFTGAVGVLAAVLVVATIVAALNVGGGGDASAAPVTSTSVPPGGSAAAAATGALPDQAQVDNAVSAARTAIGPVLSYDYRSLDTSEKTAESYMTPAYIATYSQYFTVVKANAPTTQTVVTADVLDAGVVRTAPGQVDVLLFVNRPTKNKQSTTIYHDHVTAQMIDTDGVWLVGCLITQPGDSCGT